MRDFGDRGEGFFGMARSEFRRHQSAGAVCPDCHRWQPPPNPTGGAKFSPGHGASEAHRPGHLPCPDLDFEFQRRTRNLSPASRRLRPLPAFLERIKAPLTQSIAGSLMGAMQPLDDADSNRIQAADAWVKLNALADAEAELDALSAEARAHPDALQVRWLIAAKRAAWPVCLDLAERLVVLAPDRRFGWLHLAEALDRLGRPAEAYDRLASAAENLEPSATVPLQLARLACRLNRLGEARQWLSLAFAVAAQTGHAERLRARILDDPDLAPLRAEIQRDAGN